MTIHLQAIGPVILRLKATGDVTIPEGLDILGLKLHLGLPKNYAVGFTVNDCVASPDTPLQEGDRVKVMNLAGAG